MQLSVETLLQAPESITRLSFEEVPEFPVETGRLLEPVKGDVAVTRTEDASYLLVTGELSGVLELTCDRCDQPFRTSVAFAIDESLEVVDVPSSAEEVEDTVCATGELDLTDLVRQHLLLALPDRALCGCAPLPTQAEDVPDARWQKLLALAPDEKT